MRDGGVIVLNQAENSIIEMLAELPDLWDVNISEWENDSQTSRFSDEGFQEQYVGFVKTMTSKPVVGVGRFTSPDAMISQINRGILDMIGAARPSTIASAVSEGHRVAQEFDAPPRNPDMPFRREEISLEHFEHQETKL